MITVIWGYVREDLAEGIGGIISFAPKFFNHECGDLHIGVLSYIILNGPHNARFPWHYI